MQTLTKAEQGACRTIEGLFEIFSETFLSQLIETILFIQYGKLNRLSNERADEWIGRLRIKAAGCKYK